MKKPRMALSDFMVELNDMGFWEDVYPKMSPTQQCKFDKYLRFLQVSFVEEDQLEAEVERLTLAGAAWCEQAKQCEARIEAALAIVQRLKRYGQPWYGAAVDLEKALTGGREK